MSERRQNVWPAGAVNARRTRTAVALSIGFPAAVWVAGDVLGLLTGIVIVAAWWGLRPRAGVLWALSVLLLALTPLAIVVEGLPSTRVIGSAFGAEHLLAHRVAIVSLALAAFAGLTELLGLDAIRHRPRPNQPDL